MKSYERVFVVFTVITAGYIVGMLYASIDLKTTGGLQ
jgi:hypothetical protein